MDSVKDLATIIGLQGRLRTAEGLSVEVLVDGARLSVGANRLPREPAGRRRLRVGRQRPRRAGSPVMEQVRLQKYECIFVHRLGFRRRVTVHAIDESVAERMAWAALTAARAWRPMWVVRVVLTDLANELCPECGWPLPPELARCRGCNYPDPIPAELSDRATPTKEDTR